MNRAAGPLPFAAGARVAAVILALMIYGCAGTSNPPGSVGSDAGSIPDGGAWDAGTDVIGADVTATGDGQQHEQGAFAKDQGPPPAKDKGVPPPPPPPPPPDPCVAITPDPTGSATKNWSTIQTCLNTKGHALLKAGLYPIAKHLTIPASAELKGNSSYPTLRLQPSATANTMVSFQGGSPASKPARVAYLKLDANNVIGGRANASTVHFASNTRLDHCHVYNSAVPPNGKQAAAAYVICGPCTGVLIEDNQIYNNFYGIIFGPKNTASHNNVARKNTIYNNKCDPITFMSYGVADNNTIRENGWNCENGPIPGGGIYSLNNSAGGKVTNNTIYNTCGHGLDFDRCANFTITGNTISKPGYRWNGARNQCGGAAAAALLDVSKFTIKNNTFDNSNRPWNAGSDPNHFTHAKGAATFSDLPAGNKTVIAFILARRPSLAHLVNGNIIEDNKITAYCAPASQCTGLGYFASRGTGYGPNNSWSASTTNYYKGNNPFGSQVGSKRCGANWYAASSTCTSVSSPKPCNTDDYQHNPPAGNWSRNDPCGLY